MHHQVRTVVFGSLYGGYYVLKFLSSAQLSKHIQIVGVATDDPSKPFTHPDVRLWKYPHSHEEEFLVRDYAAELGLPVYTGRVTTRKFIQIFLNEWQPDLCLMATFGQRIPSSLFRLLRCGFYNFHHSAEDWPSYPGPNPIEQMVADGRTHLVLTMHEVSGVIDDGKFVAHSKPVAIPAGVNAIEMHQKSWPQIEQFFSDQIMNIIQQYKGLVKVIPLRIPKWTDVSIDTGSESEIFP